ncbi:hypothetical protein FS837_001219 [Tulasnella sp. UAMH 9824]|nr:hypothetical protein FS837_001219 [Tulasnella sp. UAMH 9824]
MHRIPPPSMMLRENATKTLPHVEDLDVVLDLLPGRKPSPYSPQMYYPLAAVKKLAARYAAIKARGNEEELGEFKEQMLARRKAIVDSVKGFQEWEKGSSVEDTNRRIVAEKFEALGYLPVDYGDSSVVNSRFVNTRTLLTEARWATVGPHLEVLVNHAKHWRIARHRGNTIWQRQQLARDRIESYFDQRFQLEAAFRPTAAEVSTKFSVFTDIIEQPNEAVVLAESFDGAVEALPSLLKEYADPKKRLLVQRMVEGGARNVSDPPAEEDLDKVFYATTVFFSKTSKLDIPICVGGEFERRLRCLFNAGREGVDSVFRHLTFNSTASDAVGALLRCARLEETTTAEDLDALDLRFYCLGCEGRERKLARSWRDCAQHAKDAKHNTDNWRLLANKTAFRRTQTSKMGDLGSIAIAAA